MFWWLVLAVFLFLLCAAFLIAEVFVPSMGVLAALALLSIAGGIFIFFNHSTAAGWTGVFVAIIMIPLVCVFAYKIFPKTAFGKHVSLEGPQRKQGDAVPDREQIVSLVGKSGTVLTALRPVGMCDFDGQRVECVAENGYVEKDKKVKVIRVDGTQLTVRVINENS